MATAKLYPTLSQFYKNKNIGFGSELDNNFILCGVPEEKLYRKDAQDNNKSNNHTGDTSAQSVPLYPPLPCNDLSNSETDQDNKQEQNITHPPPPKEPSAPPVDLLDEDLIRFLEDVIAEQQNLTSSGNDAPAIDYSKLNIPTNIVLDESWIDDLQPDYDMTVEEIAADVLNNLNLEHLWDPKGNKQKTFSIDDNLAHSADHNFPKRSRTRELSPSKENKHHRRHKNDINGNNTPTPTQQHEKTHSKEHGHAPVNKRVNSPARKEARAHAEGSRVAIVSPYPHKERQLHLGKGAQRHAHKDPQAHDNKETHAIKDAQRHAGKHDHTHRANPEAPALTHEVRHRHGNKDDRRHAVKKDPEREKENTTSPLGMSRMEGPMNPASPEYSDWMKWRKQVNRQLATYILLRRGGQVQVQRNDMTRKPLNQRSIDFVSQLARTGNITSLGGKPYVMYGIPRATLSGSQGDIMY